MRFDIITIFPEILDSYFQKGMIRIAQEKNIIKIKTHDLRRFCVDKRGTVDDKPYGGGPGQVLMIEPIYRALNTLGAQSSKHKTQNSNQIQNLKSKKGPQGNTKIILLSARGKKLTQQLAQKFSKLNRLIFICPRYEGHDERIKKFIDEEISIGDYILTGGELGAAVIIDSVTRLLPGVLGEPESLKNESHSTPGYLEYPQYTRPEIFSYNKQGKTKKLRVPPVLLSGNHRLIARWRQKMQNTPVK